MVTKKLKRLSASAVLLLSLTTLSSFVDEGETPAPHGTHSLNLGHEGSPKNYHYYGAEMKSTQVYVGEITSNASGQLVYDGKVVSGGFNIGVSVTVQVVITDKECKDCFWGTTWCSVGCKREDDARYVSW